MRNYHSHKAICSYNICCEFYLFFFFFISFVCRILCADEWNISHRSFRFSLFAIPWALYAHFILRCTSSSRSEWLRIVWTFERQLNPNGYSISGTASFSVGCSIDRHTACAPASRIDHMISVLRVLVCHHYLLLGPIVGKMCLQKSHDWEFLLAIITLLMFVFSCTMPTQKLKTSWSDWMEER